MKALPTLFLKDPMFACPRNNSTTQRRGLATVEAAACAPVLAILVFGAIQTSDTINLQHVVTLAAYEGTLAASHDDATKSDVISRAEALLAALDVEGYTVSVSSDVEILSQLDRGTQYTVTVKAQVEPNLIGPALVTPIEQVVAEAVTMR